MKVFNLIIAISGLFGSVQALAQKTPRPSQEAVTQFENCTMELALLKAFNMGTGEYMNTRKIMEQSSSYTEIWSKKARTLRKERIDRFAELENGHERVAAQLRARVNARISGSSVLAETLTVPQRELGAVREAQATGDYSKYYRFQEWVKDSGMTESELKEHIENETVKHANMYRMFESLCARSAGLEPTPAKN